MIRLRRSATLCAIFLLAILLNLQVVEAGRLWCKADPVVTLDGRVISISLAIPVDTLLMVDGPTRIEIRTPASVERYVIVNDVGFLRGSVVVFADNDEKVVDKQIPIEIRASVPINPASLKPGEQVPLQISILTDDLQYATATGTTEKTTLRLVVRGR